MKVPPMLLVAALLFWGWQTDQIIYGVLMGALLEASRWVKLRWALSDKDFNRIADFSSILFVVIAIYLFATQSIHGIYTILQWLPFIFFLIVLAQVYSDRGKIKTSALFISLRRMSSARAESTITEFDLTYPYFFICLLSASLGNQRTLWFFAGLCVLAAWALWPVRPRRYGLRTWIPMLALAFGLAYAGQLGMQNLQSAFEGMVMAWMDELLWRNRDPNRTSTAIGSIGRLKLSDRIRLRVDTKGKVTAPLLLREATYNTFSWGLWSTHETAFTIVDPEIGGTTWMLNRQGNLTEQVTISTYLKKEKEIVPVPHGTHQIKEIAAVGIDRNPYGAIMLDMRPGLVRYSAIYDPETSYDAPPTPSDLIVPEHYHEAIEQVATDLELSDREPTDAAEAIKRFFKKDFRYSLIQRGRYAGATPLTDFLSRIRQGHCEYFATATVLLLRAAGIPGRYAVGYSIHEYSPLERQYIARARHAHAWALAHINDHWEVIDTTPAIWAPLEEAAAPWWQALFDLWSWGTYRFADWRYSDDEDRDSNRLLWLLVPLIFLLAWRLYRSDRIKLNGAPTTIQAPCSRVGEDSRFYLLVERLNELGFTREPGQTLRMWISKIEADGTTQPIRPILDLHYRYRFDPKGIAKSQKQAMKSMVETWLEKC